MNIVLYKVKRALEGTLFAIILAASGVTAAWAASGPGTETGVETGAVSEAAAETETQPGTAAGTEALIQSPVALEVTYGYDDAAKSGRFLPLTISLKNDQDQEFTGTLSVLAQEPDFQGYSSEYEYDTYRYEYPVTLAPGESLTQSKNISLGTGADQMYVILTDSQGQEIGRKRLKLNLNMETAELFVGVLSDRPERLTYLNHAGINYGTLRTRTVELTASDLPTDELGLDQLDVLLITDYDSGKLSGQQAEAVWQWVQRGGTLLIGTGSRAADTLRMFMGKLAESPLPQPELHQINMGVEYASEGPEGAAIPLICTEIMVPDGREVLSSDELSVLTALDVGNGTAAVAVYDFGDIRSFCEEHISYVDNLFKNLLGEDTVNNLSSSMSSPSANRFWSVQSLINSGDLSKLPKVGLYIILAVAYVILAGPGLYFFLKQRELWRYYQPAVALLSLCCGGMVFLMGMPTRFSGPFITYATILDADGTDVTETTFINTRAPYNKPYGVGLDPSYRIYPLTASPYYNQTSVPEFTGEENADVTIKYNQEETRLQMGSVGAFTSKYFQLEKDMESQVAQGFTGEIQAFDGEITGTLTNNYDQAVENVAVLLYNQMVVIDRMEPGETVRLDDLEVLYCATNFSYAMASQITGVYRYKKEGDIQDPAYVKAMERSNLLSFYIDNYLTGYHPEARIAGFSQDKEETQFLTDSTYETYGSTLLTSQLDVNYEKNGLVYRSAMQKKPNVLSGEYYFSNNTIYGQLPVMLEYYLGNDIDVEGLSFHLLNQEMAESFQNYYTVPFAGDMYFYNYNTGDYDLKSLAEPEYDRESLEPYLSPGNTLTVKYIHDAGGDYSWNVMLPVLTVMGRSK